MARTNPGVMSGPTHPTGPAPRALPRLEADSPWPGPAAYGENDASFFHGRTAETAELLRLIRAEPASVLYGLSGLGKTSLLQAGLFPRLRADGWLPVRLRLDHADDALPLSRQVLEAVGLAARNQCVAAPAWQAETDTLVQAFQERNQPFWGESEHDPVTPVLVFDQFEECWTQTRDRPSARARAETLLGDIAALLEWPGKPGHPPAPLRVVFSLREDQLAPLDNLRHLFPGLARARLRLHPFTLSQAREVVEKPAPPLLGPGAAEAIVATFGGTDTTRPVADPALLAIFCWRLNEDRRSRGETTVSAERAVSLRGEFVRQFYEQAFATLGEAQIKAARTFIETDLIDAAGFRTSAGFEHAERKFGVTTATLEHLADQRLLHPVDRSGGHRHVELVHDRIAEEAARQRALREEAAAASRSEAERKKLADRLGKSRRRNLILSALSVAACLAAGLSVAMWRESVASADQARRAQAEAVESKAKADREKDRAVAAKKSADELIEFMQYDLQDSLGKLGRLDLMKGLNDRIGRYHDEHPAAEGDLKSLREKAMMLGERAQLLKAGGDMEGSVKAYRQAGAILESIVAKSPSELQWQRDFSVNRTNLANTLASMGESATALALYREGFSLMEKLARDNPGILQLQRDLASSHIRLADALASSGDRPGCLEHYRQSVDLRQKLVSGHPEDLSLSHELALAYNEWGDTLGETGEMAAALEQHTRAVRLAEEITGKEPSNTDWLNDLALSYLKLGDAIQASGDPKAALTTYRQSYELLEKLVSHDPANAKWQGDLWIACSVLGEMLAAHGEAGTAMEFHRKGLGLVESLVRQDPSKTLWQRNLGTSYLDIGNILMTGGETSAALSAYLQSLAVRTHLVEQNTGSIRWWRDLAQVRLKASAASETLGDLPSAISLTEAALAACGKLAALDAANPVWKKQTEAIEARLKQLRSAPPP